MADLRVSAGFPATVNRPAGDGAKTLALRAAQKAFFDAALNQAMAGTPVAATQAAAPAVSTIPVTPVQASLRTSADAQGEPARLLRPGSLVDIRV